MHKVNPITWMLRVSEQSCREWLIPYWVVVEDFTRQESLINIFTSIYDPLLIAAHLTSFKIIYDPLHKLGKMFSWIAICNCKSQFFKTSTYCLAWYMRWTISRTLLGPSFPLHDPRQIPSHVVPFGLFRPWIILVIRKRHRFIHPRCAMH